MATGSTGGSGQALQPGTSGSVLAFTPGLTGSSLISMRHFSLHQRQYSAPHTSAPQRPRSTGKGNSTRACLPFSNCPMKSFHSSDRQINSPSNPVFPFAISKAGQCWWKISKEHGISSYILPSFQHVHAQGSVGVKRVFGAQPEAADKHKLGRLKLPDQGWAFTHRSARRGPSWGPFYSRAVKRHIRKMLSWSTFTHFIRHGYNQFTQLDCLENMENTLPCVHHSSGKC